MNVSRSFKIFHERNRTLKEALLRRRRSRATVLWALRDVDLLIKPGEAVGIVGENGSGKSTLLKLVAGILRPENGSLDVHGSVASMLELGAGFHPDFTGRENVHVNGTILGLSEKEVLERFDSILEFAELAEFIDMPVRTYSSGMMMRLAFAVASHVDPDILLLDEVLTVGDEAFQRKCFARIFEHRRRGGTLLFVSHDASLVERICDRVILLGDGAVLDDGRPQDVLAKYHARLATHQESVQHRSAAVSDADQSGGRRSWGVGGVSIVAARLVGALGPSDRFSSGDRFTVEVDLVAEQPVPTPSFGVSISAPDGTVCYGTNTHLDALPIEVLHGAATVRFTIERLALHEGSFSVTIAVHAHDESVVYHWLDRWLDFTVFPHAAGVGIVDLSGTWSIDLQNTHTGVPIGLVDFGGPPVESELHPASTEN